MGSMEDAVIDDDFKSFVDLDWTTWYCPCGSSYCNRYEDKVGAWLEEHRPHTSGHVTEVVTDDGARCLGSKPEPTRRKLNL